MCNLSKGNPQTWNAWHLGEWGGGGEYSTKYYTRRLRPEVQPLPLLYTIIHQKITPFVYLLLNLNGTLFTYPYNSLEFCAPINVTSLKYEWITTTECFLDFFTAIKCICLIALLGLFSTGMTDFPTCTTTSKISTLSYTWRLKLYPFPAVLDTKGSTPTPPHPMVKCMTHWWDCLACSSTHSSQFSTSA